MKIPSALKTQSFFPLTFFLSRLFRLIDPVIERQVDLPSPPLKTALAVKVGAFGDGAHPAGIEEVEDVQVERAVAAQDVFARREVKIVERFAAVLRGFLRGFVIDLQLDVLKYCNTILI